MVSAEILLHLHAGSLAGVSWSRKYSQVNWTRVFLKSILVWVEEEKYSWFIIQSRWRVLKYVLNILVVNYICVDVDNGKVFSCIIIIQTMLVCAKINLKVEKKMYETKLWLKVMKTIMVIDKSCRCVWKYKCCKKKQDIHIRSCWRMWL